MLFFSRMGKSTNFFFFTSTNFFPFCASHVLFFIQGAEQGSTSQEQALSAQHAAVINLAGVGSFMQSQASGRYLHNLIY